LKFNKLVLVNFKNHTSFKTELSENVVAISGLNGKGKTNVLDAINLLCMGKPYFASTDVQCIHNELNEAGVIATVTQDEEIEELKIKLKRGSRKRIEQNGVVKSKLQDYIGQFVAVTIAPQDIELIYGANQIRRNFIDRILSQTNKKYLANIVAYKKLLEHRNSLLKDENVNLELLAVLDTQIAPLCDSIFGERRSFLKNFSEDFKTQYQQLSGKREEATFTYVSQLSNHSYDDLVKVNRAKDLAVKRSFSGIHKDEIELELDGVNLKKFGSQGQIKSALISIKLAEYHYLTETKGIKPLLLLDDIFEKIDDERAKVLTDIIKKDNFGQLFITDTNEERIVAFCEAIGKPFKHIKL
jgi:DNA replication and repair protein RecF